MAETMPDPNAPVTSVMHIAKVLHKLDSWINEKLILWRAEPDDEKLADALIETIDRADELRHELTVGPARMPDEQHDFMVAMIESGHLMWVEDFNDDQEDDGVEC